MSIFDLTDQDRKEYEKWIANIHEQLNQHTEAKSLYYFFSFTTSEPIPNSKISWELPIDATKRFSTIGGSFRSSYSTIPTLENEILEDIPEISNLEMRVSQELTVSPIVLLPHKR